MLSNYYTLKHLASFLNRTLQHSTITEIFSQTRNELLLSGTDDGHEWTLVFSCDPRMNYLYLRDRVARAKKNSIDLFEAALAKAIKSVDLTPHDRIVVITLEDELTICFEMFGMTSNVLLIDQDNAVVEAFKHGKELVGRTYERKKKQIDEVPQLSGGLQSEELFCDRLMLNPSKIIFTALKTAVPTLGSTLAREILHRAQVQENISVGKLERETITNVHQQLLTILDEVNTPHPMIYYRGESPRAFSLIPVQHLAGSQSRSFANLNEALRTYVVQTFRTISLETEKNALLVKIKKELERSQHALAAVSEELRNAPRAEEYERIGKIIMANLQHLTKGTRVVELPDIFANEKPLKITLDPKLTPAQNAERYFAKAKKTKLARAEQEQRLQDLKDKITLLEKLQLHLDYCTTKEQLKEFEQQHRDELLSLKLILPSGRKSEEVPFRVFTVAGGFQVWVGKSSENNDLLTMKYAKPNDLWFHARGSSGSHVVLKVGTGNGKPSKEAIEQAASIAAYYSKMRNAKNVAVAYCERKYVRKPKRVKPGTVTLEREKVLFVEPGLPG